VVFLLYDFKLDGFANIYDGEELTVVSVSQFSTYMLRFVSISVTLLSKSKSAPSAAEWSFSRMHALVIADIAQLSEFSKAHRAFEHLVVPAS
jgi:hypothetical protein